MSSFQPLDTATVCSLTVPISVSLIVACDNIQTTIARAGTSAQQKAPRWGAPTTELGMSNQRFFAMLAKTWHSSVVKSRWVDYANNIAGAWTLCGNANKLPGEEQLFMQYNFAHYIIHGEIALSPDSDVEFNSTLPGTLVVTTIGDISDWSSDCEGLDDTNDTYIVPQRHRSLNNGFFPLPAGESQTYNGLDPEFTNFLELAQVCLAAKGQQHGTINIDLCPFNLSGAPGIKSRWVVSIINS